MIHFRPPMQKCCLLYYLAKNPEKQQKLYEETKKVLPNSGNESLTAEKQI
jgi:cytochrome P450